MSRTSPARPALLRTLNDRTVLDLLLADGPSSRADLAERSGLSKPTIAEVLSRLEEAQLIVEAGETFGRRGPNGRLHDLALDLHRGAALTVEPGRITCDVVDARGTVLGSAARVRPHVPRGAAQATWELVRTAAAAAAVDLGTVTEVVVGLPGSYDTAHDRVRYADRIPDWTVPGIGASVAAAFPAGTTMTLDNDVNLALLAERSAGAAGDSAVTSLLWLATGIGLATDLGGTLYRGVSGGAGEIGYIPVPATVSGIGSKARPDFQDVVGGAAVLRLARVHGVAGRTPAAAVERAAYDSVTDPSARDFLDELAGRIALGLAVIVAVLDPGLVVLGGAVGRAGGRELASRTARALRAISPLTCDVAASTVVGDPSLAGARTVATARVRDRLLDAANRSVVDVAAAPPPRASSTALPTPRTAEEVH
jgi:predicted NBD/HSP70 family sugar kinase